jgi:hypothetical protein
MDYWRSLWRKNKNRYDFKYNGFFLKIKHFCIYLNELPPTSRDFGIMDFLALEESREIKKRNPSFIKHSDYVPWNIPIFLRDTGCTLGIAIPRAALFVSGCFFLN